MTDLNDHADEHSDDVVAAPGIEQEALKALDAFMSAWNRRDASGVDLSFHFPHVRIASGRVHVLEKPAERRDDFFEKFIEATGWDYTLWDYRRAIQSGEDKVHFAVQFTRYRADGSVIGVYPSMWIVSLIDGRWGVQARSSFAP